MTFDPGRYLTKVNGADYLEVRWRVVWFRDHWPAGTITTDAVQITDERAVFRAEVRKTEPDGTVHGIATGYGSETPRDFRDYIEKAETKAIGRALAALGFGTQFAPELAEGELGADAPVNIRPTAQPRNRVAPQANGQSAPPREANPLTTPPIEQARFDLTPEEQQWERRISEARSVGTLDSIEAVLRKNPKTSQMLYDMIAVRKDEFFATLTR